ncbi:hypothetical protein [Bifidobacterium callitrichidarum]|uniref:Uncharacterized protein n=1 Tax=Bifidobacterium callitrichidarum TaxID=2052941 RepID=A0A2U2MYJ5_9BIFI|nr:hypothetical protein [Bifidobacterium callitrichidarum]PWG62085.1 hypothetical protein DF196_12725 [Bifidobacterium callitrichidarum]
MADKGSPFNPQQESAAMVIRAMQMRLWGLASDSATIGYCWDSTPPFLRDEYVQMIDAAMKAVNYTPEQLKGKKAPVIVQREPKKKD